MSYPNELHIKAEKLLEQRRNKAKMLAEEKTAKIRASVPEIDRVQTELANIGIEISQLFLYKGDAQKKIEELRSRSNALTEKRSDLLVKHGYKRNDTEPPYTCPACKDTGFKDNRICSCHREILKELMRKEVAAHAPLERCTFDNFDLGYYPDAPLENSVVPRNRAEKILDAAMRYAQSFTPKSKSLVFIGKTGLGKTHISLAIANVVINRGYSVCYGTSFDICEDMRAEMFSNNDIFYSKEKVYNYDLLIIDDLGTEIDNKYNISTIYNIVTNRSNSGKPTIISTNLEWDELLEKYEQRITSRLNGDYLPMTFFGTDIRQLKK
ncbi:MAG: ATP-binding protein [Eubacterium sp.]|nr:ATP-binding protein [Eubacterium sp.]